MDPTIEKQIELLRLCNEKKLSFNYSGNVEKIEVQKYDLNAHEFDFYDWTYIDDKNAIKNLNDLIEKVKNYK